MLLMLAIQDLYYQGNLFQMLIICSEEGKRIFPLSRDHKPCDELERKRIVEGGGQIYQYIFHFILTQFLAEQLQLMTVTTQVKKK